MASRVEYLIRLGYLSASAIDVQPFQQLEQNVLVLRHLILKMQVKGEFDAEIINSRLDTIAEQEKPLIAQLIEELTRTVEAGKAERQQFIS